MLLQAELDPMSERKYNSALCVCVNAVLNKVQNVSLNCAKKKVLGKKVRRW